MAIWPVPNPARGSLNREKLKEDTDTSHRESRQENKEESRKSQPRAKKNNAKNEKERKESKQTIAGLNC